MATHLVCNEKLGVRFSPGPPKLSRQWKIQFPAYVGSFPGPPVHFNWYPRHNSLEFFPDYCVADNLTLEAFAMKYYDVFTTGEAAKVCKCSQQTIIREFDEGRLKGFRLRRFRRIPRENLIKYMIDLGMPEEWQEPLFPNGRKPS